MRHIIVRRLATIGIISAFALLSPLGEPASADTSEPHRLSVGAYLGVLSWGASASFDPHRRISVVLSAAPLSDIRTYYARIQYRMTLADVDAPEAWKRVSNGYLYAQGGLMTASGRLESSGSHVINITETVPSFGLGVGVEWDLQAYDDPIPLILYLEFGYNYANFDKITLVDEMDAVVGFRYRF